MSQSGHHTHAEHRLIGYREQPTTPGPNPETGPRAPMSPLDARQARLNVIQQRLQGWQQMPGGPQIIRNQIDRRQLRSPNTFAMNGMLQRQQLLSQNFQASAFDFRQARLNVLARRQGSLPAMNAGLAPNEPQPGPTNGTFDFRQARLNALARRMQNPSALTMNRVGPMVQSQLSLRGRSPASTPGSTPRATPRGTPSSTPPNTPSATPRSQPSNLRRPEGGSGDWLNRLGARTNQALGDRNLTLPSASTQIERDPSGMANFDLPRNEPIGYVSLFDAKEPWEVDHLNSFPGMMNRAGYNFVTSGPPAMGVTNDPIGMLRNSLQQLQSQGVRYAYINLVPHGNPQGQMIFQQPNGGRITMSPNEVTALTREFRTMRFFINVNSCHGGGFDAADFSDPGVSDLVPRVTVVTQSDRNTATPVMMLAGSQERGVSYYDAIMAQYLQQGVPYGRAHCLADQTVRRMFPNRPGLVATAYRSGPRSRPRA